MISKPRPLFRAQIEKQMSEFSVLRSNSVYFLDPQADKVQQRDTEETASSGFCYSTVQRPPFRCNFQEIHHNDPSKIDRTGTIVPYRPEIMVINFHKSLQVRKQQNIVAHRLILHIPRVHSSLGGRNSANLLLHTEAFELHAWKPISYNINQRIKEKIIIPSKLPVECFPSSIRRKSRLEDSKTRENSRKTSFYQCSCRSYLPQTVFVLSIANLCHSIVFL